MVIHNFFYVLLAKSDINRLNHSQTVANMTKRYSHSNAFEFKLVGPEDDANIFLRIISKSIPFVASGLSISVDHCD